MHARILLLALCLLPPGLLAREVPQVHPAKAHLNASKLAEVDAFMIRQVADHKIAGGIVMISHRGRIGFFHTYGLMDIESGQPMREDTIFRIYSMSKAITSAAALVLHEEGRLGLDDPVAQYIPSFANLQVATPDGLRPPTRPVTIRDLMLHTSGMTYGTDGPPAVTSAFGRLKPLESTNLVEMVDKLSHIPLAFDPGTDWTYGVGIDVLGRVIEVISGESLDVYLSKSLFEPLDMKDTGFFVPPEKLNRFAANYTRTDDGLKLIDDPTDSKYARPATFYSGGGGLVSTPRDYMRFLSMIERGGKLHGKRILRRSSVNLMMRNQLPDAAFPIYFGDEIRHGTGFGLGFSVRTEITSWDPDGHPGEYGWGGAASTHYWSSPADRLIVITFEQIMPYQWDTEFGIKKLIYDAVR